MTENQKQLKIFFNTNYRYEGFQVQETYYEKGKSIDNIPFEAELEYIDFSRGRSALNILWKDNKRKRIYYSGMYLLDKALKENKVVGSKITGEFCFKKQGTSILLQAIKLK